MPASARASKQAAIASFMLANASSSVRHCDTQPGIAGHSATNMPVSSRSIVTTSFIVSLPSNHITKPAQRTGMWPPTELLAPRLAVEGDSMPSWGYWALRQSLRSSVFRSLVPKLKNSATSAILSASKGCARDFDHRAEHVLHTLGLGGLDDGRHLHVQNILVELFAAVLDRLSPAPMVEPQTHAREVRERVSYCDACCARGGPRQIESRSLTYSRFVLLDHRLRGCRHRMFRVHYRECQSRR